MQCKCKEKQQANYVNFSTFRSVARPSSSATPQPTGVRWVLQVADGCYRRCPPVRCFRSTARRRPHRRHPQTLAAESPRHHELTRDGRRVDVVWSREQLLLAAPLDSKEKIFTCWPNSLGGSQPTRPTLWIHPWGLVNLTGSLSQPPSRLPPAANPGSSPGAGTGRSLCDLPSEKRKNIIDLPILVSHENFTKCSRIL